MKNFVKLSLVFAAVFLSNVASAVDLVPMNLADKVEQLSPAVVNISTTQKVKVKGGGNGGPQFSFPPGSPFEEFNELFNRRRNGGGIAERDATSLGSGFIIDPKGIVITNNHVVADADEITVVLQDDTKLIAEVVGRDAKIDVAVLRIKPAKPLPYVSFGDSDNVRVGDWIIAIGNPYGLGGTVTTGIISARARDINVGSFDDFLQTDAAINRGNSGGPMFDLNGNVIGINTAIFSPTGGSVGIGFAIPSALAKPIIDQILQYGKAKRAWLGVQIQPVTDSVAEALGMSKTTGALVLGVVEGGPAQMAGLITGDVILKFAGKEISDMKKLPRYVADSPIGERATIQVLRGGKVKNLAVDLAELKESLVSSSSDKSKPNKKRAEPRNAILGMQLRNSEDGLIVEEISQTSDAFSKGVRRGSLLKKANQRELKIIGDLESEIAKAKKAQRESVLVLVSNGKDSSRFVTISVK